MDIKTLDSGILIADTEDFSPPRIFECGQCFRWTAEGGVYTGVAGKRALTVETRADGVLLRCGSSDYEDFWRRYFDMDRDYGAIRRRISRDGFTAAAAEYGRGIRILRQEKWETLCTFILSQCNHIRRIRGIVERLCTQFGDAFTHNGEEFYGFPSPERLAGLNAEDLAPIRAGYRAAYLIGAAEAVASGLVDLEGLEALPTGDVRAALMSLKGVGGKVGDCILLYGYGRRDAFPMDVWMRRAVDRYYGGAAFSPRIFGEDAGAAQQYIFHYIRHLDSAG